MKSTTTSNSPRGESIWRRVLLALPLLALFFIARTVLTANVSKYLHLIEETVRTGFIDNGGQQVPLRKVYTGLEGLDNFLAIFVAFFTPALAGLDHSKHHNLLGIQASHLYSPASTPGPKLDEYGILYAPQRLQTITLIADFATLNVILALESCRRGNSKTIASM